MRKWMVGFTVFALCGLGACSNPNHEPQVGTGYSSGTSHPDTTANEGSPAPSTGGYAASTDTSSNVNTGSTGGTSGSSGSYGTSGTPGTSGTK